MAVQETCGVNFLGSNSQCIDLSKIQNETASELVYRVTAIIFLALFSYLPNAVTVFLIDFEHLHQKYFKECFKFHPIYFGLWCSN